MSSAFLRKYVNALITPFTAAFAAVQRDLSEQVVENTESLVTLGSLASQLDITTESLATSIALQGTIISENNNSIQSLGTQISALTGAMRFGDAWNAMTNTPSLTSGQGVSGVVYQVTTAGTIDLDGISEWDVGDEAVFSDITNSWVKFAGNPTEVLSVVSQVGVVTAEQIITAIGLTDIGQSSLGQGLLLTNDTLSVDFSTVTGSIATLNEAISERQNIITISGTDLDSGALLEYVDVSQISINGNAYLSSSLGLPVELGVATEQTSMPVTAVSGSAFICFEYDTYTATPPVTVTNLESIGDCNLFYGTFTTTDEFTLSTSGDGDTIAAIVTGPQTLSSHFSGNLTTGTIPSILTISVQEPTRLYLAVADRYNNCPVAVNVSSTTIDFERVSTFSTATEPDSTSVIIGMNVPIGQTLITLTAGAPGFSSSAAYIGIELLGPEENSKNITLTVPPLLLIDSSGTTIAQPQTLILDGTLTGNSTLATYNPGVETTSAASNIIVDVSGTLAGTLTSLNVPNSFGTFSSGTLSFNSVVTSGSLGSAELTITSGTTSANIDNLIVNNSLNVTIDQVYASQPTIIQTNGINGSSSTGTLAFVNAPTIGNYALFSIYSANGAPSSISSNLTLISQVSIPGGTLYVYGGNITTTTISDYKVGFIGSGSCFEIENFYNTNIGTSTWTQTGSGPFIETCTLNVDLPNSFIIFIGELYGSQSGNTPTLTALSPPGSVIDYNLNNNYSECYQQGHTPVLNNVNGTTISLQCSNNIVSAGRTGMAYIIVQGTTDYVGSATLSRSLNGQAGDAFSFYGSLATPTTFTVPNNAVPSDQPSLASFVVPASTVNRTLLIIGNCAYSSNNGSSSAITLNLDNATEISEAANLGLVGTFTYGFNGNVVGIVTIPGDNQTHTISMGCYEYGGGTGYTGTFTKATISGMIIGALPTVGTDYKLVSTQVISAQTNAAFGPLESGYEYEIRGYVEGPSTSTYLGLQLGTGSEPVYDSSSSDYHWSSQRYGSASYANNDSSINLTAGSYQWQNSTVRVTIDGDAGNNIHSRGVSGLVGDWGATVDGFYTGGTAVTSAQLFLGSGTISGTFSLYSRKLSGVSEDVSTGSNSLVSVQTISGASSVIFPESGTFQSGYIYSIIGDDIVTSSTIAPVIQFGIDANSDLDNTPSNYLSWLENINGKYLPITGTVIQYAQGGGATNNTNSTSQTISFTQASSTSNTVYCVAIVGNSWYGWGSSFVAISGSLPLYLAERVNIALTSASFSTNTNRVGYLFEISGAPAVTATGVPTISGSTASIPTVNLVAGQTIIVVIGTGNSGSTTFSAPTPIGATIISSLTESNGYNPACGTYIKYTASYTGSFTISCTFAGSSPNAYAYLILQAPSAVGIPITNVPNLTGSHLEFSIGGLPEDSVQHSVKGYCSEDLSNFVGKHMVSESITSVGLSVSSGTISGVFRTYCTPTD